MFIKWYLNTKEVLDKQFSFIAIQNVFHVLISEEEKID